MTQVLNLLGDIAKHDPAIVAVVLVVCAFLVFMYLQGRDQKEDRKATREVMQELNVTLKQNATESGAHRVQSEQMVQALDELHKDRTDLIHLAEASMAALRESMSANKESTQAVRESAQVLGQVQRFMERNHA